MEKFFKWVGIIALLIIIFMWGYYSGKLPDEEETVREQSKKEMVNDISTVASKYQQLYDLCEQKYQTGIGGDLDTALELKGQATAIEAEISRIMNKYDTRDNTNAILQ